MLLKIIPNNDDLKEIRGNIMFASVLANTKLLEKSEVVVSKELFKFKYTNIDYLEDYHVITKKDNPEVIIIYIQMAFEEGVALRYKDLPNEPVDMYKSSKK